MRCTLVIEDQVNIRFRGLDPFIRKKIVELLKKFVPNARHTVAFKLGRWDGKKSFGTVGGGTYLNLLDQVLPLVMETYEVDIDDRRPEYDFKFEKITENYLSDTLWPKGHVSEGQPIMLRDYQVGAINRYIENPQSIQCISTGAGKTIITATLSKITEKYGRSIVVVPSKSLVMQTEEDYKLLGLDCGVFFGDRKEYNKKHTICTWQSLSSLAKKTRRSDDLDITFQDFIKDVVCIQIDEAHIIKGAELLDILCGPMAEIPLRWGLTGTIPKEEWEWWCLLSAVGPVVGEIRADDLQAKGVLATCDVEVVEINDGDLEFADYHSEYDFLVNDEKRLKWLAEKSKEWALQGNTLILVDRIETGKKIQSMIEGSNFISGSTKAKRRKEQYSEIQEADGTINIATYGVAAVGINIPRLFNVVLLEAGKSFVRVIQSIGRGLRKAHDKNHVGIKDVCSNLKFSKRHRSKRISFYNEQGYPYKMKKENI